VIKVNGERFICTGGAGFIGSHIVEELRKQGKQIRVLDDYSAGKPENIGIADAFRHGAFDITKRDFPEGKCDVVFHLACGKNTVCRTDPLRDLMVNAWGTFRVCGEAINYGAKVVHASTGSVYGDNNSPPVSIAYSTHDDGTTWADFSHKVDETTQYAPKSFYGVSKLAGEQYLRAFREYYNLRFVALRLFHVYGPRQDSGPSGGVIAIFITKMLRGEPIQIFGDGCQVRSFTYVKDVVRAFFLSANSPDMEGQYFNVASGFRISLNELVAALESIIGVKAKVEYLPEKKGDIRDFNVSNSLIASHGMAEWTAFEEGLRHTVDWYRRTT
jgi:UDP-glucose 4-epimerase